MKYHYMNILYRNIVLEKYDEIDKTFRVVCYIYFSTNFIFCYISKIDRFF